MPISEPMTRELFLIAQTYKFPKIHERLTQIGHDNLSKYMTPERYSKVKNAMKFNDPSKAIKALALLPNDYSDREPATNNQISAIWSISKQWFMPLPIQHLLSGKEITKLTKRQASTVIDRLKRIEKDTQDADDIDTAADPTDVRAVKMILYTLPNSETKS